MNQVRFVATVGFAYALGVLSIASAQSAPTRDGAASTSNHRPAPGIMRAGLYTCGSILSGSIAGNTTGMTIGQISIVGPGVYTSLVKEGTGSKATFSYDAASGTIEWDGGRLAGFFGKIVESRYSLDNKGRPVIRVTYRVREGGNLFDLSCQ